MRKLPYIWMLAIFLLAACSTNPPPITENSAAPAATSSATQNEQPSDTPILLPSPSSTQTETPTPTTLPPSDTPAEPSDTPTPAAASSFPDVGQYVWQPVVGGLRSPVGMAHAGDGSGRLFVLEQYGMIRIVQDGTILPQPFLDIVSQVNNEGNEQGLLGLAFHPRYNENGYFYINYTDLNGDTVIARYQVSPDDPNRADPASETRLFHIPQPYANHNGGGMEFGPDGYLYLGLGDGGAAGDPLNNGQSLNSLLGKILRIDVNQGDPYAIPVDNPFASGGGLPEIWAYGLRNPWRFSFDRLTGDLYIGDVGQNQWEEIDYLPAGAPGGANFGWNYFEGSHPYQGILPPTQTVIAPVAEYSHAEGCSVTGGVVYHGGRLPEWQGVYLYGDYCTGRVWGLLRGSEGSWMHAVLFDNVGRITSFGEDEQGEIYLIDRIGILYTLVKK